MNDCLQKHQGTEAVQLSSGTYAQLMGEIAAALDCTLNKQHNPPWSHPHLPLNITHNACESIHHSQGNVFWADAWGHGNQLQGNIRRKERMSWGHYTGRKILHTAPAQKYKNGASCNAWTTALSMPRSRILVHGTPKYTKPDWPIRCQEKL